MISVEHLMEIQERLHNGDNIDDVFNDVYELGRADGMNDFANWLIKYKVIPDGAMQELLRDFKGEIGD